MPNMNRLTWSGIALHAGQLPGYPASHGCVRLPKEFSELLFGVTKLGMTVVIADDKSQPEEVTHPGMVLGEYAAREFNAVEAAIKTAEYSEGHEAAPTSPSAVISSADKSIRVFDNGALAASGKVEIENPEKPLGERVFTLTGADDQSGTMAWQAAGVGTAAKTTGEDNGAASPDQGRPGGARSRAQAAQIRHDDRHDRSTGRRQHPVGRRVRGSRFGWLKLLRPFSANYARLLPFGGGGRRRPSRLSAASMILGSSGRGSSDTPFERRWAMILSAARRPKGLSFAGMRCHGARRTEVFSIMSSIAVS
jgi:hypothetical protein